MSDLTENLDAAHQQRGEEAMRDLGYAKQAPSLFKPEWTADAQARLDAALANLRYWRGIGA